MMVPRILVIGAGSRGNAYSKAIHNPPSGKGPIAKIVGVAEPNAVKRRRFCEKYDVDTAGGLIFEDWKHIMTEEGKEKVMNGVDGIIIATLDDMHTEGSPPS
jgi:predicted dehydrogenase